jgi:hypothetical protein
MKLYFECKKCHRNNDFDKFSTSRMELENEVGMCFPRKCQQCLQEAEYHVNDIIAVESKGIAYYILGGISIFFTLLILLT